MFGKEECLERKNVEKWMVLSRTHWIHMSEAFFVGAEGDAHAQEEGVTFVVGMTQARSSSKTSIFKKYLVHEPFLFLVHNFTSHPDLAYGIPANKLSLIGLPYLLD